MVWNIRIRPIRSCLIQQVFCRKHNGADSAVVPASKYGILTAKFHLLGEPPKTPPSVEHIPPLQSVFPLVPKE